MLEITRADIDDLSKVWRIIDNCAQWLAEQNLNHWAKYYNEEMIAKMITRKEVYLALNDGNAVGTATFDTKPPKYYSELRYGEFFTDSNDSAAYLTAVAVLPKHQGRGYAKQLIEFIADQAKARQMRWLRLDCRAEVPNLVNFYEKRGFKKLGDSPIDEGEDGTYWFMEKGLE